MRDKARTNAILTGLAYCYLTTIPTAIGILVGAVCIPSAYPRKTLIAPLTNWDGQRHVQIAKSGYSYLEDRQSNVVSFPGFPIAGRSLARATGWEESVSLLVVSHLCLIATFCVLHPYIRRRFTDLRADVVVMAFGLWPTTFFFRMAYNESLLALLLIVVLYGIHCSWNPAVLAIVSGLATATRPVGVALMPVVLLYAYGRVPRKRLFILHAIWLLPLSAWGLLAFAGYQYYAFGDPFAFIQTQKHFSEAFPDPVWRRALSLITFEPAWSVYVPSSYGYWANRMPVNPMINLSFANPIFFVVALALLYLGVSKRWLNHYEAVLSAGLLAIPYVLKADQHMMESQGRYAAVAIPLYFVMGQILLRAPKSVAIGFFVACTILTGCYAALFAAYYRVI